MTGISKEEALHSFRTMGRILQEVYGLQKSELLDEIGVTVPSHAFRSDLSPFSAVCTWLNNNGMNSKDIARHLKRNKSFVNKSIRKEELEKGGTMLPLSIFTGDLSILEATAHYLKQRGKSNSEIAEELGKSTSAVWIILDRAEKKLKGDES